MNQKIFSFYRFGIENTRPNGEIDLDYFMNLLKNKDSLIDKIRNCQTKDERNALKRKLDYVTFAGTFTERGVNGLKQSSGLACLDVDGLDNLEEIKEKIILNKHTHLCFISPSGKGLKILVQIPEVKTNEEYKEYYLSLSEYYKIPIDENAKDISRACYISFDEDYYFNPTSEIYTERLKEKSQKIKVEKIEDWEWLIKQACDNWIEGKRQENALSLAGFLRKRRGCGIETTKSIIQEICNRTEDKEVSMRLRAVDETFKKNENEVKGISGLDFLNEKEEQKVKFEIYNDFDLKDYEPEPIQWLIKNQIPKSEIGLLVGKRGVRKTFTALRQAISIASGKSFLDDEVLERKKVLIIDEENGKNEIAKRTKLLKSGMNIQESLDIHFLSFENIKLDDPTTPTYECFEKVVSELKPDLIIVDCLQRILNIEIDRDNQGISAFFTGVARSITKRFGCSWLFIHHMRKGNPQNKSEDSLDEIRGGSELVNYCRFVLMCAEPRKTRAKEEKTLMIFEVLKMSNSQIPPAKVVEFKSNEQEIIMNYIGSPEEILNTEAKIGEAIKSFILQNELNGEFRSKDILDNYEKIGFKRSSLNVGLRWLEDNGILIKEKRGIWRLSSDEEI